MNKKELIKIFTDPTHIQVFATFHGGSVVHKSWRDNMLKQNREVAVDRMKWNTLPTQDVLLDRQISEDVIREYLNWIMSEYITGS